MNGSPRKLRDATGSMIVVTVASIMVCTLVGVALVSLLFLFGSQRQANNATDAALLAIGKEAVIYPYYDLTANAENVPNQDVFLPVADDSPAKDGHKVINLGNINKVWATALIPAINLDAMVAESKTRQIPDEAFNRVKGLRDAADQLSAILKRKLETEPETQARFKKIAAEFLKNNPGYLKNSNEKISDHVVSFLNRGQESNVQLNLSMLDNLGSEGPGASVSRVATWLANGKLRGYTDDIKIELNGRAPLVYHFVPLKTNSAPHLVSFKNFLPNQNRRGGDRPFNWENAVPNSFAANIATTDEKLTLTAESAVISQLVGEATPVELNHGFIRIENAEGLNLETRDGGGAVRTILSKPNGAFSAADYANAQLLVQRSMQNGIGGSMLQPNRQEQLTDDRFRSISDPVVRDQIIELNQQVTDMVNRLQAEKRTGTVDSVARIKREIEDLVESINTTPEKANIRQELIKYIVFRFGSMPDPQRYPLVSRFAATLSTLNDARMNIEKGLVEFGTVENCFIQSRQATPDTKRVVSHPIRPLVSDYTVNLRGQIRTFHLPPLTGRMVAGMGVLPAEPASAPGGQRNPIRTDRVLSAGFRSGSAADALRITRDGSPYEYLQGDAMSPVDITARKTDGSVVDKVTPTCAIVRLRLIQRIKELAPNLSISGPTDIKLKNLLNFGFAVEDINQVTSQPQPKVLPMGTNAYIFKDKVRLTNGNFVDMVVMKTEAELPSGHWLFPIRHAKPDGNTLLLQGRFFDGTNHRLTGVTLNMEGDYGYARPYHLVSDVCQRDRYKWTPSTGANHLLGVLRFETTLNDGSIKEAEEQTEGSGALNFGQFLGPDEEYEEPVPCQGVNTRFTDPFGYEPQGLPASKMAAFDHERWPRHFKAEEIESLAR